MYRDREEVFIHIKKLCDNLQAIALEDDQITDDEQAILDIVNNAIQNLEEQTIQIFESELDNDEFSDLLMEIFNDIVKNVVNTAKLDGVITSDEQKLIDRIRQFISEELS